VGTGRGTGREGSGREHPGESGRNKETHGRHLPG